MGTLICCIPTAVTIQTRPQILFLAKVAEDIMNDVVHVPEMTVSEVPATTSPAEAGDVVEMSVSTI